VGKSLLFHFSIIKNALKYDTLKAYISYQAARAKGEAEAGFPSPQLQVKIKGGL
jgi:hypothetical protein